jgi:hypothetical protein
MGLTLNQGWRHCVYMPDDGSDTEVISNLMHKLSGKTFEKTIQTLSQKKT